jgi:hypothetical protein
VQERKRERRQRDEGEQGEGDGRPDEAVVAVRGVGGAQKRDCSRGGQDAGDHRIAVATGNLRDHPTPHRFTGTEQDCAEDPCENEPRLRTDEAGLYGIADEEDAAQRKRYAADPDGPPRTEGAFERVCGGLRRGWRLFVRVRSLSRRGGRFIGGRVHCERQRVGIRLGLPACRVWCCNRRRGDRLRRRMIHLELLPQRRQFVLDLAEAPRRLSLPCDAQHDDKKQQKIHSCRPVRRVPRLYMPVEAIQNLFHEFSCHPFDSNIGSLRLICGRIACYGSF